MAFFLSGAWIFPQTNMCSFSVILLCNLNLDNVRLCDVDPLCFPVNRGIYRSHAGSFLH